jgi:hypothetical protein
MCNSKEIINLLLISSLLIFNADDTNDFSLFEYNI